MCLPSAQFVTLAFASHEEMRRSLVIVLVNVEAARDLINKTCHSNSHCQNVYVCVPYLCVCASTGDRPQPGCGVAPRRVLRGGQHAEHGQEDDAGGHECLPRHRRGHELRRGHEVRWGRGNTWGPCTSQTLLQLSEPQGAELNLTDPCGYFSWRDL